ncbi:HEAT repeat domain-containing protein [Streptomyces flavochromogenes]|uniref:HEAT repeat domain-containing protein n=1 Tax=Streptomyces flavochromogenes TaxID=68199 RepID=A0ABW6XWV1_9ACTN|nr:hypothetical protein [Streptomyces flavochromogenes]
MDGYRGLTALIESAWNELNGSDTVHRDHCLDVVGDVLETGRLAQADVERAVERLVTVALSEQRYTVRESALHAVSTASTHYELPYRVVEPLVAGLEGFEPLLLAYVLSVLSCTHDQAALPVVERSLHHPHAEVRWEAAEAVHELLWSQESARGGAA